MFVMNIYIVFVLGFFLSWIAKRSDKRIYVFILIILLGLFVGLRNQSVGDDTATYYSMFSYLRHGVFSPNYEYGFSLISFLILRIFNGYIHAPFIVFGLLTNLLIINRLWSLRKDFDFCLSVLLYMIYIYPSSCNLLRQYISLAIVFWSLRFLDKRQNLKFCFAVLIATAIHISAAVSIIYLYIYMKQDLYETENRKRNEIILGFITFPVIAFVGYYVLKNYSSYFEVRNNSIGLFNVLRIFFILISVYISKSLFVKDEHNQR